MSLATIINDRGKAVTLWALTMSGDCQSVRCPVYNVTQQTKTASVASVASARMMNISFQSLGLIDDLHNPRHHSDKIVNYNT